MNVKRSNKRALTWGLILLMVLGIGTPAMAADTSGRAEGETTSPSETIVGEPAVADNAKAAAQPTAALQTLRVSGTQNGDYANEVLRLVNIEREKVGVAPLTMDQDLLDAAMQRAAETALYVSHTRPDGSSCFTVSKKARAENIAAGQATPAAVVESWMNSPGHRTNMLSRSSTTIGVGCFDYYWVQLFGDGEAAPANTAYTGTVQRDITYDPDECSVELRKGYMPYTTMFVGESQTVETTIVNQGWKMGTVTPAPGTVYLESSDPSVVTVDQSGVFTAKAVGTANITASLAGSSITYALDVHEAKTLRLDWETNRDNVNQLFALINAERESLGLAPYVMDQELVDDALKMAAKQSICYYGSTDGRNNSSDSKADNYTGVAGYTNPETVFNRIKDSSVVTSASYQTVGIGNFGFYWDILVSAEPLVPVQTIPDGDLQIEVRYDPEIYTPQLVTNTSNAITLDVDERSTANVSAVNTGWTMWTTPLDPACLTWTTSNPAVATVKDGVITGVGEGTAVITGSTGEASVTYTVTVNPPYLLGDIDGSGKKHPDNAINANDALLALRHSVKEINLADDAAMAKLNIPAGALKRANVTAAKDPKEPLTQVDASDALQILRYSVKEINSFY